MSESDTALLRRHGGGLSAMGGFIRGVRALLLVRGRLIDFLSSNIQPHLCSQRGYPGVWGVLVLVRFSCNPNLTSRWRASST